MRIGQHVIVGAYGRELGGVGCEIHCKGVVGLQQWEVMVDVPA